MRNKTQQVRLANSRTLERRIKMREIYTDGSCLGNPGPGGWGWTQLDKQWAYGSYAETTNNQMEIYAVIDALRSVKGTLKIYTDSQYVANAFNKWIPGWQKRNWITASGKPVANRELWEQLISAASSRTIEIVWVKAHSGNIGNEIADRLALEAAQSQTEDRGKGNPYPGWNPAESKQDDNEPYYGGNTFATDKQVKYASSLCAQYNMPRSEEDLAAMTKSEISDFIDALKNRAVDGF